MKSYRMSYKEFLERCEFYAARGEKYQFERSGNSIKFFCPNKLNYYVSTLELANKTKTKKKVVEELPIEQVFFIPLVKEYIMRNRLVKKIQPNYRQENKIKYFEFNKEVEAGRRFRGGYSVDITKAYWRCAYVEGWLSEELYARGLEMNKRIRLASLGSFAKSIDRYVFDGREEKLVKVIEPRFPHVFLNQANVIYKLMERCRRALPASEFLFYWTDGVYVSSYAAARKCEEVIAAQGYGFETKRLRGVERHPNCWVVVEYNPSEGVLERKAYNVSCR